MSFLSEQGIVENSSEVELGWQQKEWGNKNQKVQAFLRKLFYS